MEKQRRRNTHRRRARSPQRQRQQQVGGASLYFIPAARRADWQEALAGSRLASVFPNIWEDARGGTTVANSAKAAEYFATLERQDELFELAIDIIKTKLGPQAINSDAIVRNAAAIDSRRSGLLEYLKDAEALVAFKGSSLPTVVLSPRRAAALPTPQNTKTKFGMIYSDRTETLPTLLLFPARVRNVFLEALANIIVYLDDATIELLAEDAAKQILKDQLDSYAQAYAYSMTARPLRDGLYVAQTTDEYATIMTSFWRDLIVEMINIKDVIALTELFKPDGACPHMITVAGATAAAPRPTFGYLAAHLWKAYKLGADIDGILALF
ncbi:MAG: hypothetical protein EBV03_13095, partial [Proteobacteria bacterium]|nr:hypothetical protein [Pseudomonadota bacterium]